MDFKKLHTTILEIIDEIGAHPLLTPTHKLNPRIADILNQKEEYITIHDVANLKPIFLNNVQRDFYGFTQNHLQQEDYFFYLSTIHPSCYSSLFASVIHFKNAKTDFLNLEYKLKKHNGKYEKFKGATKAIFIGNQPKFALSVLEKIEKNNPVNPEHLAEISLLTPREKEIAILYCEKTMLEISQELNVSQNTIKTHLKNIFRKLKINNVKELTQIIRHLYP